MARRRPDLGIPRRARPGVLEVLLDGAGELVQSVAVEVVPPVVDALDVDAVVQRVDIEAIVERIDLDAVLAKVDINALMERVDIDAVLARTEFGAVVSRSAGVVAGQTLDFFRSQGVGIDAFISRWTARLLRRGVSAGPAGPPRYFEGQNGARP